ncbi:hypothetical protein [Olivibacter domesticus]|nr:hypothetical protein [Olivibacter domesticus]
MASILPANSWGTEWALVGAAPEGVPKELPLSTHQGHHHHRRKIGAI